METTLFATSVAIKRSVPAACLALVAACPAVHAQVIQATIPLPAMDRWMYPFDASPGTRPTASTFGTTSGDPEFDNRDGQIVVSFSTQSDVPAHLGAARYTVLRAVLELEVAEQNAFIYDDTQDSWSTFLSSSDPAWTPDLDPGQPIECFGVGFRNGWTAESFVENAPYAGPTSSPLDPGVRNAYALAFAGQGAVDASNSVREQWDPTPFGIGAIAGLPSGSWVPQGSKMRFELAVSNSGIQSYLQQSLETGTLFLAVTSLTKVEVMGGQFPSFIQKEHALVILGLAHAARLELQVSIAPACAPADFNCDGRVDGADLGVLLGAWGTHGSTPQDLTGDGTVDGADLGVLLGAWG